MILLVHLIFGATIGTIIRNVPLAIFIALFSHYLLDTIPHLDYSIKDIEDNRRRKVLSGSFKVVLDLFMGIYLVLLFSSNQTIVYVCAFFALFPDGLTVLKYIFPGNKILESHYAFHQKVHFLKDKKISTFWRIFNQIAVVIISVIILLFLH